MNHLRIAIAQINPRLGDFSGNQALLLEAAVAAHAEGARLLLAPEMALSGQPPEDLLLYDDFYRQSAAALENLARQSAEQAPGLSLIIGHPQLDQGQTFNSATLIQQGRCQRRHDKCRLDNDGFLNEGKYFTTGRQASVFEIQGIRCAILICADLWDEATVAATLAAGAELLLVLDASPYTLGKTARRQDEIRRRLAQTGLAVVYANLVGAEAGWIFEGHSFALNADGRLCQQLPAFQSGLGLIDFHQGQLESCVTTTSAATLSLEASAYEALKLGLRDYITKNNFPGVILGLSGGVDSALVLALAADALGAEKVRSYMLPSPYTSQMSLDDAREMAQNLGVLHEEIPIEPAMQTLTTLLAGPFAGRDQDLTEENLQARIRGLLLMAISNKTGALLLGTSNKSEVAVGYSTLYGDMACGLAIIADVYKTFVYQLCRYRNQLAPVIPQNILERPPSAELRPDQTDQDSLPDYATLDAIVSAHVENRQSMAEIVHAGHAPDTVKRVLQLISRSEYKRRQAAPSLRIMAQGFGSEWRWPLNIKQTF